MKKSKQAQIEDVEGGIDALNAELNDYRERWIDAGNSAKEIDEAILSMKKKVIHRVRWHWKCRTQGERTRVRCSLRLTGGQK